MPDAKPIYRWLLKLYPARFREEYAGSLERQFQDEYREARGRGDKALLWLRALADSGHVHPRADRARNGTGCGLCRAGLPQPGVGHGVGAGGVGAGYRGDYGHLQRAECRCCCGACRFANRSGWWRCQVTVTTADRADVLRLA